MENVSTLPVEGKRPPPVVEGEIQAHKLFVGNLDPKVSEYVIIKLFKKFGTIVRVSFMWHREFDSAASPPMTLSYRYIPAVIPILT